MQHQTHPHTYDCGDGVPDLVLDTDPHVTEELAVVDIGVEQKPIGAALAFLALTIAGQLVILLAVLAGGNPLVGAAAGVALLVCALTVLGAKTLRLILFDH